MLLQIVGLSAGIFYILLFASLVQLIFTYLVYQDAKSHTTSPELWAVLVFLTPLIGLILYLVVGRDRANNQGGEFSPVYCTDCGTENPYDASHCRGCGSELLDTQSGDVSQSAAGDNDAFRNSILLILAGIPVLFFLFFIVGGLIDGPPIIAFLPILSLVVGTCVRVLKYGVEQYYRNVLYVDSGKKEPYDKVISGREVLRLLGGSALLAVALLGLAAEIFVIVSTELRPADVPEAAFFIIVFATLPLMIAIWSLFGGKTDEERGSLPYSSEPLRLAIFVGIAVGSVVFGIVLIEVLLRSN